MKKSILKILTSKILVAFVLTSMILLAITTNVYAKSQTTRLSVSFRANEQVNNADRGKVQYSLNDGATWIDVTANMDNVEIAVTGDNLRLKIVPNENYSVDYAGIVLRQDEDEVGGLSGVGLETGYSVPSNVLAVNLEQVEFGIPGAPQIDENNVTSKVEVHVRGSELEYDNPWSEDACDFIFGINTGDMKRLPKNEVDYIRENNQIVGLDTKQQFDYGYDYDDSGKVKFTIRTQWNDLITSLKINGVSYSTPQTKADLIKAYENGGISFEIKDVPYATSYIIEVTGRKQHDDEIIRGNFGWTYDVNTNEYSDDDKIPYAKLEFVKAVYGETVYDTVESVNAAGGVFKWHNGEKGTNDPYGEASFPPGTVLTIRLIPDAGYQLTSFDLNGFPFEPGDEVGLYTFTIGGGNWHLGAHFTEEGNVVQSTSTNIKNGNIKTTQEVRAGTLKLEVSDIGSMSSQREEKFIEAADMYEIDSYMNVSLYNAIYKGGKKDNNGNYESWDTEVNNLEDDAIITLKLSEDMQGKDIVLIHETHDGDKVTGYEVINTVYDEANNTITFKTDSFSTYAIATIDDAKKQTYTVSDEAGNEIIFKELPERNFTFTMLDYLKITDEELEVLTEGQVSKEAYDALLQMIKDSVKDEGETLAFYEIMVTTTLENGEDYNVEKGPLTIKLKATDTLKKYKNLYLIYLDIDDQNNITKGEKVKLTLSEDGKYYVGTLPHLSKWVLAGNNNIEKDESNPKTGDKLVSYISLLGISTFGLIYLRKKKLEDRKSI